MALGIDAAQGNKHILGLREGFTKSTRVVRSLRPCPSTWAKVTSSVVRFLLVWRSARACATNGLLPVEEEHHMPASPVQNAHLKRAGQYRHRVCRNRMKLQRVAGACLGTVLLLAPWQAVGQSWKGGVMGQVEFQRCTRSCLEDPPKNKDAQRYCRFMCGCSLETTRPWREAWALCESQYSETDAPQSLRKQSVSRAGFVYALRLRGPQDMSKEDSDIARLNEAEVLECTYRDRGVNFWYRKVPLPPAQLREAAGRKHELIASLGHTGVDTCPKSLAEANELKKKILGQAP